MEVLRESRSWSHFLLLSHKHHIPHNLRKRGESDSNMSDMLYTLLWKRIYKRNTWE